jgi:hypothetical protein
MAPHIENPAADSARGVSAFDLLGGGVEPKNSHNEPIAQQVAVDLLDRALNVVRPLLYRGRPLRARLVDLWAAVAAADDLAATDVLDECFMTLAGETGLAAELGRHADEDLKHIIRWARLRRDPFGFGRARP